MKYFFCCKAQLPIALRYILPPIMLMLGSSCESQEPVKPTTKVVETKDSILQIVTMPTPPKSGIVPNEDPIRQPGYAFVDTGGKEIQFLSEKEIYNRNPYKNIGLKAKEGGLPGRYQSFNVHGLSVEKKKNGLPKGLKSLPADSVLKKVGRIISSLESVDYNRDNPQFLVVSYALEMYGEESMTEVWVETTIQVYNNKGRLVSTIVDNHNIQGTIISPDGKYILANEILGRIGDGWSEAGTGLAIYDMHNENLISVLKNRFMDHEHFLSFQDGKFSFYGAFAQNYVIDGGNDSFTSMKFIIDPLHRILYQKPYLKQGVSNRRTTFMAKSTSHPDGEDLSSYEKVHF